MFAKNTSRHHARLTALAVAILACAAFAAMPCIHVSADTVVKPIPIEYTGTGADPSPVPLPYPADPVTVTVGSYGDFETKQTADTYTFSGGAIELQTNVKFVLTGDVTVPGTDSLRFSSFFDETGVLDLSGHTVSSDGKDTVTVDAGGRIMIDCRSGGSVTAGGPDVSAIDNRGVLTVLSGDIVGASGSDVPVIDSIGILVLEGTSVRTSGDASAPAVCSHHSNRLSVSGGVFTATGTAAGIAVSEGNAAVSLDCSVETESGSALVLNTRNPVMVNGGSYASACDSAAVEIRGGGPVYFSPDVSLANAGTGPGSRLVDITGVADGCTPSGGALLRGAATLCGITFNPDAGNTLEVVTLDPRASSVGVHADGFAGSYRTADDSVTLSSVSSGGLVFSDRGCLRISGDISPSGSASVSEGFLELSGEVLGDFTLDGDGTAYLDGLSVDGILTVRTDAVVPGGSVLTLVGSESGISAEAALAIAGDVVFGGPGGIVAGPYGNVMSYDPEDGDHVSVGLSPMGVPAADMREIQSLASHGIRHMDVSGHIRLDGGSHELPADAVISLVRDPDTGCHGGFSLYGGARLSVPGSSTVVFHQGSELEGPHTPGNIGAHAGFILVGSDGSGESSAVLDVEGTLTGFGGEPGGYVVNERASDTVHGTVRFLSESEHSVNLVGDGKYVLGRTAEAIVSEDVASYSRYLPHQTVVIDGDVTVSSAATLEVEGRLVVGRGSTLTVEAGGLLWVHGIAASAEVGGTLVSNGASSNPDVPAGVTIDLGDTYDPANGVSIDGMLVANGTGKAVGIVGSPYAGGIVLNGSLVSGAGTECGLGRMAVSDTGVLDLKGKLSGGSVLDCAGIIRLDCTADGLQVNMTDGAELEIISLSGDATVTDADMVLGRTAGGVEYTVSTAESLAGYRAVPNTLAMHNVKGAVIDSSVFTEDGRAYNLMALRGKVIAAGDLPRVGVESGRITVPDTAEPVDLALMFRNDTADPRIGVDVTAGTVLDVDGTAWLAMNNMSGTGGVEVDGHLKTTESRLDGLDVRAVHYASSDEGIGYQNYTTLKDAVAGGHTPLTVLGELDVTEDIAVPSGMSVSSASAVNVSRGCTLSVEDGGVFAAARIVVAGTLVSENGGVRCPDIVSDAAVFSDPGETYTDLPHALRVSSDGDTVRITKSGADWTVRLSADAAVPAGVTLEVPSENTLSVRHGVTLSVFGKLLNRGTVSAYRADGCSGAEGRFADSPSGDGACLTVGGTVVSSSPMPYSEYRVPGAYYRQAGTAMHVITTLGNAAVSYGDIASSAMSVNGGVSVGDLAFEGTEGAPLEVSVEGNAVLKAGKLSLDEASFVVNAGAAAECTFACASGSVSVSGMGIPSGKSAVFSAAGGRMSVSGSMESAAGGKLSLLLGGEVAIPASLYVDASYTDSGGSDAIGVLQVPEGSSAAVTGTGTVFSVADTDLQVDGRVSASGGGRIEAGTVTVAGSFSVIPASGPSGAGTASVDTMYVGMSGGDIGGIAAVSGKVDFSPGGVMYVLSGSSVDDDTVYGRSPLSFSVLGSPWMTAYAMGSSVVDVNVTKAPLGGEPLLGWRNDSHSYMPDASGDIRVPFSAVAVEAIVDSHAREVRAMTEPGVDAVYIDGNLMTEAIVMNDDGSIVTLFQKVVPPGYHFIGYSLANGYSGNAVLFVNGEEVPGMVFSTMSAEETGYDLVLQGIHKSGYVPDVPRVAMYTAPDDGGITDTDRLLIVLVVMTAAIVLMLCMRMLRR